MDLLPKDHKDFSTKEYWHDFFTKQKSQHFEWYCEYNHLSDILDRYIKMKDRILIIGCGSSKLSADLYDVGMQHSVSIDSNALVIHQMKEKYCRDRPNLVFETMDVCELPYEDESFAVALDKGTLDALFVDESSELVSQIEKMFSQIDRILRNGGRYLCISLLQEHILKKILDWFLIKGWLVRIHRCSKAELKQEDSMTFPVFLVVLTKMKKMENSSMILEIVYDGLDVPKRCSSKQEAIDYIKSTQHFSFLRHYIHKKKLMEEEDICLELYCPRSNQVKYRMFVVDRAQSSVIKFAIFIVPQGREIEWLFSTAEGRKELASTANCERLVIVHLLRSSIYDSLEEVKKDLSEKVLELAPFNYKSQVPILSLGDDVGTRKIRCTSSSKMSGDYVVEDVASSDNDIFRRLIFLNNPYLVQSEAKLIARTKKGSKTYKIDFDHLACDHHKAIVSGLAFLKTQMLSPKVLQIGLGGGSLAMYLHKHLPDADIEALELDPEVVSIAEKWFSLTVDQRLRVHVDDGLHFVQEAVQKGSKYDAVILDVDSKEPSLGISSPPIQFLEPSLLETFNQLINDSGIVIMNLTCRNAELRKDTFSKLKDAFEHVFSKKIPAEVNEVVYCLKDKHSVISNVKTQHETMVSFLNERSEHMDAFDTNDLMSSLNQIK